jgi:repressor LexA
MPVPFSLSTYYVKMKKVSSSKYVQMKTFARIVDCLKVAVGARSDKELADMLGVNYRTFATQKRRNSIPYEIVIRFCTERGIDLENVFRDEKENGEKMVCPSEKSIPSLPLARMLPVFENIPPSFPERVSEESIQQYVSLPDGAEGSFGLTVKDESMSPVLKPGDYVVFHHARSFSNRDIVVINDRWGETRVRRYRADGNRIFLAPDNPEYQELKVGQDTQPVGLVIAAWRRLNLL